MVAGVAVLGAEGVVRLRPVKLLHVVASYLPATRYGGTIVSVHGLCRALARRGHDVHVFTTSVDGDRHSPVPHGSCVDVDGVSVWHFESRHLRRFYYSPDLKAALCNRVGSFDAVHTHAVYLWPLWTAARYAQASGVPYVVSPRGMLEKSLIEKKSLLAKALLIGFIERHTLEGASAVHVTSRREADEAAAFGFSLPRMVDIPNGVDLHAEPGRASDRIQQEIDRGPFVLFLGRLNWKKGLDRLVAALRHAPRVRVIVAGMDQDGYRAVLQPLIEQLGVAAQVCFVGEVLRDDKAALLSHAAALVLPSYSENFGNVVVESMAAGRPVVITPEVGMADIVRRADAGMVVDGEPAAIGRALSHLIEDASDADRMGGCGRQYVERELTWDAVAGRMERLYSEIRS